MTRRPTRVMSSCRGSTTRRYHREAASQLGVWSETPSPLDEMPETSNAFVEHDVRRNLVIQKVDGLNAATGSVRTDQIGRILDSLGVPRERRTGLPSRKPGLHRSREGNAISGSEPPRIAHKCAQIPDPMKKRTQQATENYRVIVGAGRFERPTPCAQGRWPNVLYQETSPSFRRRHSPGRRLGASKSRRIPCFGRSGIKVLWKLNKINGDVKSPSVHNWYTKYCK